MKIGGHGLRDHLRLLAPLFGLIAAVWALRLVLDAAGAPLEIVRLSSLTVATPVCVLLAVLLIHSKGFGGYSNVAISAFLLSAWTEGLIAAAIYFSILTGTQNVFIRPEFSFHEMDPWRHMFGHLTFGIGIETLMGTAMGCFLLWVLRHAAPIKSQE